MLHIIAVSCVLYPRVFYFWLSFLAAAAATVKTLPEDRLNCNLMLFVPLFFFTAIKIVFYNVPFSAFVMPRWLFKVISFSDAVHRGLGRGTRRRLCVGSAEQGRLSPD